MTDRKVTVNENDLRVALKPFAHRLTEYDEAADRLYAAMTTPALEPCGHPSWRLIGDKGSSPLFRCEAPKGHHAYNGGGPWGPKPCCHVMQTSDPIHCGDAHQPPADVWAE